MGNVWFVQDGPPNGPHWQGLHPRSYPTHWMPLPLPPVATTDRST